MGDKIADMNEDEDKGFMRHLTVLDMGNVSRFHMMDRLHVCENVSKTRIKFNACFNVLFMKAALIMASAKVKR